MRSRAKPWWGTYRYEQEGKEQIRRWEEGVKEEISAYLMILPGGKISFVVDGIEISIPLSDVRYA